MRLTEAQLRTNPFLVLVPVVRVRDFQPDHAEARPQTWKSFYVQDDWKVTPGTSSSISASVGIISRLMEPTALLYLKLNNFMDNLQPRFGFTWDFTGKGRGKIFVNYATVPRNSDSARHQRSRRRRRQPRPTRTSTFNTFNCTCQFVMSWQTFGNLGSTATPIDPDLKPRPLTKWTAGIEYRSHAAT